MSDVRLLELPADHWIWAGANGVAVAWARGANEAAVKIARPAGAARPKADPGTGATAFEITPDDVIIVNVPADLEQLDRLLVALAWAQGAADVVRTDHPALPAGADPTEPGYGLAEALGANTYTVGGRPLAVGDEPREALITRAAAEGWCRWIWRPNLERRRTTPPGDIASVPYRATGPGKGHQVVFELGFDLTCPTRGR